MEVEEIIQAIRKMKKKKTAGILMTAWIYEGTGVKNDLIEILKQIWKKGVLPKDWKTNIIVPIFKKSDQEQTENYRGVSLLCTAYKIYAEVIRKRLEEKMERKEVLSESQTGFRKGRGALDNIFILNHLVQRERRGKEEKSFGKFWRIKE